MLNGNALCLFVCLLVRSVVCMCVDVDGQSTCLTELCSGFAVRCPWDENSEHILIFISYLSPSTITTTIIITQIENEKMSERERHTLQFFLLSYKHTHIDTHEIGSNQIKYGRNYLQPYTKLDSEIRNVQDMREILDRVVNTRDSQ